MKNWQDWVWNSLLGLVVIFLGGQILATAVTFVALASPPVANYVFCPTGRVAKINPNPFKGTSKEFGIICYDQKGLAVVAFAHTDIWALERDYFHTSSYIFVSVLVVGYFFRRTISQKMRNKRISVA